MTFLILFNVIIICTFSLVKQKCRESVLCRISYFNLILFIRFKKITTLGLYTELNAD